MLFTLLPILPALAAAHDQLTPYGLDFAERNFRGFRGPFHASLGSDRRVIPRGPGNRDVDRHTYPSAGLKQASPSQRSS